MLSPNDFYLAASRKLDGTETVLERAFRAPFGLLLAGQLELLAMVSDHNHNDTQEGLVEPNVMEGNWAVAFAEGLDLYPYQAVSYTHLTLPTTPYV